MKNRVSDRWVALLAARRSPSTLAFQRALQQLPLQSLAVVRDGYVTLAYLHGEEPYCDRAAYPFPNVLLIDCRMPSLSGLALLCWLRNLPHFAALPTVVLAKDFSHQQLEVVHRLGAACCRHASTPDEIQEAIRRSMGLAGGPDSEVESGHLAESLA